MISCAILKVPVKEFGSTPASITSANERTMHTIREPVKNGSYANITPELKQSCVRAVEHDVAATNHLKNTCGYPEVGVANLNPCDLRKLSLQNVIL